MRSALTRGWNGQTRWKKVGISSAMILLSVGGKATVLPFGGREVCGPVHRYIGETAGQGAAGQPFRPIAYTDSCSPCLLIAKSRCLCRWIALLLTRCAMGRRRSVERG